MRKYFPPKAAEIHSLGWGLMDGISFRRQGYNAGFDRAKQNSDDVRNEPHYYRLGYFLANRGKWCGAAAVAALQAL